MMRSDNHRSRKMLRTGLSGMALAVALNFAPVSLNGVTSLVGLAAFDQAAAEEKERRKPPTKKAQTLTKKVFERLQKAQEALGEGQHAAALEHLNAILERGSRLKEYEVAVTEQTIGYVYADQEDYRNAAVHFKKAIDVGEKGLPEQAQKDLMYNLGQLYMALEDYDAAIKQLTEWFNLVGDDAAARAYILLGNAYYQKDNIDMARKLAEKAIIKGKDRAKENWYRFLLALYFQQDKYKRGEKLLEVMITKFPDNGIYWRQLSAVSAENKKERRSFVIAELAYQQKMLDKGTQFTNLAQLYNYYDIPFMGAKVMVDGFKQELIEETADNYEVLANAYMGAREHEKVIAPLTRAAGLAEDGELYVKLGQAYASNDDWAKAKIALEKAMQKGGLKQPHNALSLLGNAYYNENQIDKALATFKKMAKLKEGKKIAHQWIAFLERQKNS